MQPELIGRRPINLTRFKQDLLRRDIDQLQGAVAYLRRSHFQEVSLNEFASVISEVVNTYKLRHKDIADQFGVNQSTIYRWQKGKNAPHPSFWPTIFDWLQEVLRQVMEKKVMTLAALSGDVEDKDLAEAYTDYSYEGVLKISRYNGCGEPEPNLRLVHTSESRITFNRLIDWDLRLKSKDTYRPTFEVFEWEIIGNDPLEFLPSIVAREMCIIPLTSDFSIESLGKVHKFSSKETASRSPVYFQGSTGSLPLLAPVKIGRANNKSGQSVRKGLLLLSSELGVPTVHVDNNIFIAEASDKLEMDFSECNSAFVYFDTGEAGFEEFEDPKKLKQIDAEALQNYSHGRAINLKNFKIYYSSILQKYRGSFPPHIHNDLMVCRVMKLQRYHRPAVDLTTHRGVEVIVPLIGAIDCHIASASTLDGPEAPHRSELRSYLAGKSLIGSPEVIRACKLNEKLSNTNVDILAMSASHIAHGFSAITKDAKALCFSVDNNLDTRDGWRAYSNTGEIGSLIGGTIARNRGVI